MNRSILFIICQWYSGSSMLNLLLDQQEGIRGIGECYHVYNGAKNCYCSCGHLLPNCPVFRDMDRERFYDRCFTQYGCDVLVDSSKTWENFAVVYDPAIATRGILLSKTPHAWLFSRIGHHMDVSPDPIERFREYLRFYEYNIRESTERRMSLQAITYEGLVAQPYASLQTILDPLGTAVDPATLRGPWTTDTHIAGGNRAVYHQFQSETAFFDAESKYRDKRGELFLDDAWKDDRAFRQRCAEAYRVLAPVLDPLLCTLGHLPANALAEEIDPLPISRRVVLT